MKFYGRKEELEKLKKMYANQQLSLALVYGRRRVGKSELIKQSLKSINLNYIYYECKKTTEMNNVESLSILIAECFKFPKPDFKSMEDLLDYLFDKSLEDKLILVLDEYSYLSEIIKGFDSILQSLVDKYRESSKLKLIICGSYIDIMRSLLEKENPLYGRVDLTINLKPMDYYDTAKFYTGFSEEDKVRLYSVFGGIPYYNMFVDEKLSVKENIIRLVSSQGARLENEVETYLNSEISKINNANEVFETLAKGYTKFNDLLSKSHVSSGPTLVDVLNKLINMELVIKEAPINDENNKRKINYYISDNMSLFYYRYIFIHNSQKNIMEPIAFYDKYIAKDFDEYYVPHIYERICKQYLIRQNRLGLIKEPIEKIGKYYYDDPINHKNGEFDIVTLDSNGYIFYEAKFREKPISKKIIDEEINQVNNTGIKCYKYGFISRSGFEIKPNKNMIFIKLKDLYSN